MSGALEGRVAWVTGAGSGIGRASSVALAEAGAAVMLVDIDADAGKQVEQELRDRGARVAFGQVDVTDEAQIVASLDATVSTFGHVDVLHNNAGIMPLHAGIDDTPTQTWERVLSLDLTSVFLGCKHAVPHLRAAGGGAIVNTASLAGIRPFAGGLHYTAAKAGVVMFSLALASQLAPDGIRVNALCPTGVETNLVEHSGGTLVIERHGASYENLRSGMLSASDVALGVRRLVEGDLSGRALLIDRDPETGEPRWYTASEWRWDPLEAD